MTGFNTPGVMPSRPMRWNGAGLSVALAVALAVATLTLVACSSPEGDQLRTVKSYEFATCDSIPTSDATELAALDAFRAEVLPYFTRSGESLFATYREDTTESSGLREYSGPFHFYVHPRKLEPLDADQGVDWAATVFLHAREVRLRPNDSGEWRDWNRVRTRNFAENPTLNNVNLWICLVNAEIAWADVVRQNGEWVVTPLAISVYESEEIGRLLPRPTEAQIRGEEGVEYLDE